MKIKEIRTRVVEWRGKTVYRLLGGRTKARIPVYASRLYSTPLEELAAEAQRYKQEGYKAKKLRFGWGPVDGSAPAKPRCATACRTSSTTTSSSRSTAVRGTSTCTSSGPTP